MKTNVFQLSHRIKNIHQTKLYEQHTHWRKGFSLLPLLKDCESLFFEQSRKACGILWSV